MAGYEQAQVARKDGHLVSARKILRRCAEDTCPEFIRNECHGWLEEVNASIPSFVIIARTSEGETTDDVEVTLDGKLLTRVLGAQAIDTDPGEHELVLRHQGETVERTLVLREGERSHQVVVEFGAARPSSTPPQEAGGAQDVGSERNDSLIYVLGGVGVAGLVAFTYFGLDGLSQRHDMEDTCKPSCTQGQIDDTERAFLFADIGLVVGVASLSGAIYLYLSRTPSEKAARYRSRFAVAPVDGGGLGVWSATF